MVQYAQPRILRALAKLRGRSESYSELGYLASVGRLQDGIEDVDIHGVDVARVAGEWARALEDFTERPEPPTVFARAPGANPLMALSLLLALEADKREDVRRFRSKHLAGKLAMLPEWVLRSDPLFGAWRLMTESAADGGEWYGQWWRSWIGGWAERLHPFGGFEELRELSATLAADYSWQHVQAADYVLTRAAPLLPGIVTTGRLVPARPAGATYITLECSPTTTPREVMADYAVARRKVLGPRHRPLTEKHLALAVFGATERARGNRWKAILAEWNSTHPEWSYTRADLLSKDWRAARERVMRPSEA